MTTPKEKFIEYVRHLGLRAEENETYEILEKRVANHFMTDDTVTQLAPMLAMDATDNPEEYWDNPAYICEEKLDGIRMLMHFFQGKVKFTTRGKDQKTFLYNDRSPNYPHYQRCYRPDLEGTILDGEILGGVRDSRTPIASIQAINGALPSTAVATQKKYGAARYRPFDIIRFKEENLTDWSWKERRLILENVCKKVGLVPTEVCSENKKEYFDIIAKQGGEGIMLKHIDSEYAHSRMDSWLKVKRYGELEAIITGFNVGGGKNKGKVGACQISKNGKVIGAFGAITDALRNEITDKRSGILKQRYYGRKVLVRYQLPQKGLLRHCRFVKFIKENEE